MTLIELHNKLGECMEKISSGTLTGAELEKEIERSKAVALLAGQMVRNSNTILSAKKAVGSLDETLVNAVVGS